jgi:hypothetical protein
MIRRSGKIDLARSVAERQAEFASLPPGILDLRHKSIEPPIPSIWIRLFMRLKRWRLQL